MTWRARSGVLGLVVVVLGGVAIGAPAPARSEGRPKPAVMAAHAAESAAAAAKESGQAVEVAGRTTEYQRMFANPSGTFTVEQSATPVRVRRGASWTPVDTTLRRHADGSVRPGAALFDVAFSGGGTVPLARLARGSRSLALVWPTALREPVLAGDTATYPDVLPGVDLVVRAEVDGFAQVLVVKNAQAAKQPQLRRLRFGARTAGMSLRADSAGGFTAVDASGAAVFTSPEPLMWDSKGGAAPTAATSGHSAAGEDARARAPRDGDQIAPMRVEVGADTLTVVPDPALLDSPHFPLYLDPPVHGATRTGWAMVNRSYPGQEYFKWGGTEGMGWTDQEGTHLKRLYFNFDTRPVARKHIVKATFKAFETHSHSCTVSRALLELTSGVTAGTNWANQPTWVQPVTYRDVAYGRTGCTPGGAWVEFNAHSAVANAASKSWAQTTLRLRAADEGNRSGWKRFRNDAVLSIEYNTPPATPTALRTQAPATQCTVSANRPVIPDDPPILTARLNDADGAKGQTVKANFELWENDGKLIETYRTAYKLPNVDYTVQLPRLGAGSYSWRAIAHDGINWSAWSAWCDFTVDLTKPATPTVSAPAGQSYRVGSPATFTLGAGGSTDVVRYKWSFTGTPTSADVPASAPTISVPLRNFGAKTLRVWSFDRAGNRSEYAGSLSFVVAGGSAVGHWKLDEGLGSTAANGFGPAPALSLLGGTAWTDGVWFDADPSDRSVHFDGTSAVATSGGAEVIRTDDNFSVSAWVRLPNATSRRVAVSQAQAANRGFALSAVPAGSDEQGNSLVAFEIALPNPDAAAPAGQQEAVARSEGLAVIGEWVHLAAVYEAGNQLLTLYVNYDEVSSAAVPFVPANEVGGVRLGRAQVNAAAPAFWLGEVDDVYVFAGALDSAQVLERFLDVRPRP